MVSGAVLTEILATSRIAAAERDAELLMLRLALEGKDWRIEELEGERAHSDESEHPVRRFRTPRVGGR
jgi:hypothetical protein